MISDVARAPRMLADRYELIQPVGRGGMGEVWAGRDVRLGRNVAVKLLSPTMASEAGVRERFEAEARSAACLSHPNVVLVSTAVSTTASRTWSWSCCLDAPSPT